MTRRCVLVICSWGMMMLAGGAIAASPAVVGDPGQTGPCPVASQVLQVTGSLTATVYYPSGACGDWASAPYPAIAFAHGFSLFGFTNGVADNAGNGEHLASWGFVAALPRLPDDAETRTANLRSVIDAVVAETARPGSFLYQRVDVNRIGVAGHSLGGATALAAAARDGRVQAVVALDPVYHEGGFSGEGPAVWNPQAEAPLISAPVAILGAPPTSCNAQADYGDIYPLVGATHKAWFRLTGASHCDFTDPGNAFCSVTCGATSTARTVLSQRTMTAWFNYYLHHQLGAYAYLFGQGLAADIAAGALTTQADTAPRSLAGASADGRAQLSWAVYDHAVVAGYDVFKRRAGEPPPATPWAQVGKVGAVVDAQVSAGETISYTARSRDEAGNPHGLAAEIAIVIANAPPLARMYLPLMFR